jgi:hypothetical protein
MELAQGTKVALVLLGIFQGIMAVALIIGVANDPTMRPGPALGIWIGWAVGGLCLIALWRKLISVRSRLSHPAPPRPRQRHPERDCYCTRCGTVAEYRRFRVGSGLVCFVLFLVGIVPGVIYYVWAKSAEHNGCRRCGSREIVPVNSPVARRALEAAQGNA